MSLTQADLSSAATPSETFSFPYLHRYPSSGNSYKPSCYSDEPHDREEAIAYFAKQPSVTVTVKGCHETFTRKIAGTAIAAILMHLVSSLDGVFLEFARTPKAVAAEPGVPL
jgi:hypothetical protein